MLFRSKKDKGKGSKGNGGGSTIYTSPEDVVDAIESAGFEAEVLSVTEGWDQGSGEEPDDGRVKTKVVVMPWGEEARRRVGGIVSQLKVLAPDLKDTAKGSEVILTYTPTTGVGPRSIERYFTIILGSGFSAKVVNEEAPPSSSYSRVTKELNSKMKGFIVAFCLTLPVFLFSMILPMMFPRQLKPLTTPIYNGVAPVDFILLAFATPVQFCSGWTFYKGAFKSIKNRNLGMDVLVVVGTTASYGYGILSILESAVGAER